ncbi:hypothetical protein BGZ76_005627 [Entomortierella beljakovae]|nr:hypothetical protein BGZ76_005627 [Entomortierella beljakovae]
MSYAVNVPTATVAQSTTCLTCGIRLPSLETQQLHHKSDWHTYNLKRKVVYLPPVSSDVFTQLVNTSREQANPAEVPQPECIPCGKKYLSFQAYDNHLNSKKHKQIASVYEKKQQQQQQRELEQSDDNIDSKPVASTTPTKDVVELEPSETICLFCSYSATDASANYEHMRTTHGFFLPSTERLIDLPGMLTYLSVKLMENYDCLWCTPSVFTQNLKADQELHSGFSSLKSVRRHMNDKGHCKLAMDQGAEREYADFYLSLDDLSDDETHEYKESLEDSAMDTDDNLDEDQKRLNMVLLDENGNWILDSQISSTSGIRVDPTTNELVLNHRRLTHKDAVRRQKVDSRAVTLTSRSQHNPNASTETDEGTAAAQDEESRVSLSSNPHQQGMKVSRDLLKSQNQLAGSSLALSSMQLQEVATKTAKSQEFESTKRERMATKLSLNNNYTARGRIAVGFGLKV